MKKSLLLAVLAVTLAFSSGAGAQMTGSGTGMKQDDEQQRQSAQSPQNMPEMLYSEMMAYAMGPDMMDGEGMGPGMMRGYGMGTDRMGGAYGYRHRMPRRGNCYGFGYGPGRNPADQAKFQKFLDETREMRKKLLLLRFDYREKLRNPATTMQDLFDMQKDMFELQRQIREKAAQ